MSDLTAKEHAFVNSYLAQGVHVVGSKAAIEAGYAAKSAAVTASKLLKKTHVAAEIARRRQVSEKKSALTAEKVVDALNNLVDFDPGQCFDADGKLLPINQIPLEVRKALTGIDLSKPGGSIKYSSRLGAIELAAKLLGMVKEQQVQQQAVQITIAAPSQVLELTADVKRLVPEWDTI